MWLGLTYNSLLGAFSWLDGTPLNYSNRWEKLYPLQNDSIPCAATWGWNVDMAWANRRCDYDYQYYFACQLRLGKLSSLLNRGFSRCSRKNVFSASPVNTTNITCNEPIPVGASFNVQFN